VSDTSPPERRVFETIAEVADPSAARILIIALKAHGFHPLEGGESCLPGLPGVFGPRGVAVSVPEDEAADARLLAESLLTQMRGSEPPGS
jgi:hypothetical protein